MTAEPRPVVRQRLGGPGAQGAAVDGRAAAAAAAVPPINTAAKSYL